MDLSEADRKHLRQAMNLALMSECNPRTRHGCVIVKSGNPIAVGINSIRNDPRQFSFQFDDKSAISVHAEEACLRALGWRADGCTAYVARLNASGLSSMSRPCPRCMDALIQAGVKKICYTTSSRPKIERI